MGPVSTLSSVEGFWPIFFLLVVLKIPVFGALWLVWWASREPEPETAGNDSDDGFKRWNPGPARPRGPHDGPHSGGVRRGLGTAPGRRRSLFRTDHLARGTTRTAKKAAGQEGCPTPSRHIDHTR
jgi:hypothetical protein